MTPGDPNAARWWIAALGAGTVLAIYGLTIRAPALGFYHDDGIYAVTAKALAEGQGYRIISLPDEIPQTKYPILFPLGLSLIWTIAPSFPANLVYLKLLPLAGALLWLWAADRLLTGETDRPGLSRGIVILTAASPSVLRYSTILLAESLFAGLAWSGLWMLSRCERQSATGPRLMSASILCAAAYHTRTVGLTLIAAGVAGLAIRRKFRAAVVFGALSGALALPWLLWSWSQAQTIPEFYEYYTSLPYRNWNVLFGFSVSEKISIVGQNVLFILIAPAWLVGFHAPILWPLLVAVGLLVVIGFVKSVRRRFGVVHVFVIMYVGALLLWAWPPARFLLTVYPLLLGYAAIGGLAILGRIDKARVGTALVKSAIVLVGFAAGWGSGKLALGAIEKGIVCFECERGWQDFQRVMSSIEESAPPRAILMGTQDPMLYLYTGRKAIRAYDVDPVQLHYSREPDREPLGGTEQMAERMAQRAVDYLVLTHRGQSLEDDFLWSQFLDLKRSRPALLEPEMVVGSPDFGLYKVNRDLLVNP